MAIVCRYPGKVCPNDPQGACITSPHKCLGCYWKREEPVTESLSAQVLYCYNCFFWVGRCSEPTLPFNQSVNRIASSEACIKFKA